MAGTKSRPTFTFTQPQRKQRVWMRKESTFPVPIASETLCPPSVHNWNYYTGYLQDSHVVVKDKSDMEHLWKMGFFGKNSLPRPKPDRQQQIQKTAGQRPRKFGWWTERKLQLVDFKPRSVNELISEEQKAQVAAFNQPERQEEPPFKKTRNETAQGSGEKKAESIPSCDQPCDRIGSGPSCDQPRDQYSNEDSWKSDTKAGEWPEPTEGFDQWETTTPEESAACWSMETEPVSTETPAVSMETEPAAIDTQERGSLLMSKLETGEFSDSRLISSNQAISELTREAEAESVKVKATRTVNKEETTQEIKSQAAEGSQAGGKGSASAGQGRSQGQSVQFDYVMKKDDDGATDGAKIEGSERMTDETPSLSKDTVANISSSDCGVETEITEPQTKVSETDDVNSETDDVNAEIDDVNTETDDVNAEIDDVTCRVAIETTEADLSTEKRQQEAEHLLLTFEEAFFLSYGLGCLSVLSDTEKLMTLSEMWEVFLERRNDFLPLYVVYHNFRSKGWVPKSGTQFGVDYVLYKDGPPFYHATYSVIVKMVNESDLQDSLDVQQRSLTWTSLAGLNRITESVHKELMICYVIKPTSVTDEELMSPKCLPRFNVQEVIVRRWVSARERENAEYYEIP